MLRAGQSAFETSALLHERGAHVRILSRRTPFWFDPDGEVVPLRWTRLRHSNFGLGPGWRAWLWFEAPLVFHYLPMKTRLANAYSTFGPAGSGWLKHRVVGKMRIQRGAIKQAIETANGLQVTAEVDHRLQGLEVGHVIAATGYSAGMAPIPFLKPVRADIQCLAPGIPALKRVFRQACAACILSATSVLPPSGRLCGLFAAPTLQHHILSMQ